MPHTLGFFCLKRDKRSDHQYVDHLRAYVCLLSLDLSIGLLSKLKNIQIGNNHT